MKLFRPDIPGEAFLRSDRMTVELRFCLCGLPYKLGHSVHEILNRLRLLYYGV